VVVEIRDAAIAHAAVFGAAGDEAIADGAFEFEGARGEGFAFGFCKALGEDHFVGGIAASGLYRE